MKKKAAAPRLKVTKGYAEEHAFPSWFLESVAEKLIEGATLAAHAFEQASKECRSVQEYRRRIQVIAEEVAKVSRVAADDILLMTPSVRGMEEQGINNKETRRAGALRTTQTKAKWRTETLEPAIRDTAKRLKKSERGSVALFKDRLLEFYGLSLGERQIQRYLKQLNIDIR